LVDYIKKKSYYLSLAFALFICTVCSFSNQAKPIAVICHAAWVLINAERIQAEQLTSHQSIRLDLENAGAIWVDEAVHTCYADGWTLISSRSSEDLPAFNQAILKELESNSSV
jgi:protease I